MLFFTKSFYLKKDVNEELGMKNCGKLLLNKGIAKQCTPKLFTPHSSPFTKKRLGSFA